jgi:hypothetical protein
MPRFYQDVEAEFEVDISEFLESLDRDETEKLVELLKTGGLLENLNIINPYAPGKSTIETEFDNTINKIYQNYVRLTSEEEELLKKIASRF